MGGNDIETRGGIVRADNEGKDCRAVLHDIAFVAGGEHPFVAHVELPETGCLETLTHCLDGPEIDRRQIEEIAKVRYVVHSDNRALDW